LDGHRVRVRKRLQALFAGTALLYRLRRVSLNARNRVACLMGRSTLADVAEGVAVTQPEVLAPEFTVGEGSERSKNQREDLSEGELTRMSQS
jgi:hypothetical protein